MGKTYKERSSTAASRRGYTYTRRRNEDGTTKDVYYKPYVHANRQRKVKGKAAKAKRSTIAFNAFVSNPERMSDAGLSMIRKGKGNAGSDLIHKAGVLADSYNRSRGRMGKKAGYDRVARVLRRSDGVKQTYWVIAKKRGK